MDLCDPELQIKGLIALVMSILVCSGIHLQIGMN